MQASSSAKHSPAPAPFNQPGSDTGKSSKPGTPGPVAFSPRMATKSPLATPLRVQDFYALDTVFDKLNTAVKSACADSTAVQLPKALTLQLNGIRQSLLEAEQKFSPSSYRECCLLVTAAKANQVRLLTEIDGAGEAVLPAARRTELHQQCSLLGDSLSKIMLQIDALQRRTATAGGAAATGQQKRTQAHKDSPTMTVTAQKKRKLEPLAPSLPVPVSPSYRPAPASSTASPMTSSATSSQGRTAQQQATSTTAATSTASTTSMLAAAPMYKPSVDDKPASTPASASPATHKMRLQLPAQRRPRPASQLFTAPPDFKALAKPAPTAAVASPKSSVESTALHSAAPSAAPSVPSSASLLAAETSEQ